MIENETHRKVLVTFWDRTRPPRLASTNDMRFVVMVDLTRLGRSTAHDATGKDEDGEEIECCVKKLDRKGEVAQRSARTRRVAFGF